MRQKTEFVGVKTLNASLMFVSIALGNKNLYNKICKQYIEKILFEVTLPLLLITDQEVQTWQENQVEYVRQQVDFTNGWNVKRTNQQLISKICKIRQTRSAKISVFLTSFLNVIVQQLQSVGEDLRKKEALMHAFGLLPNYMAYSSEYQKNAELLLQQFVYNDLKNSEKFLRARAAWVYAQFAHFPMEDEHLKYVLDCLYQNLMDSELPVKVNSAIALVKLLSHELAINIVKPGLGTLIKIFLRLIDEIEYDELIDSLRTIVDVFSDEISPYAIELC